jgi:hypothetical protein
MVIGDSIWVVACCKHAIRNIGLCGLTRKGFFGGEENRANVLISIENFAKLGGLAGGAIHA